MCCAAQPAPRTGPTGAPLSAPVWTGRPGVLSPRLPPSIAASCATAKHLQAAPKSEPASCRNMGALRSCFPGGRPTHPPGCAFAYLVRSTVRTPETPKSRTVQYRSKAPSSLRLLSGTAPSALACMLQMMPQSSVIPVYLGPYSICSERSLASLLPPRRKDSQPVLLR